MSDRVTIERTAPDDVTTGHTVANPGVSPVRRMICLVVAVVSGVVAVLALSLAFGGAAGAAPYPPGPSSTHYPPGSSCTVSTTTVKAGPGDTVTLVGSGFAPNETVSLSIPSAAAALGSVTTTNSGTFRATFTWPASVSGRSAVVQASAPSTTCSFTLTNARFEHASSDTGGSGLSSTGFAALTTTLLAVGLLGAGALVLVLARRRRV